VVARLWFCPRGQTNRQGIHPARAEKEAEESITGEKIRKVCAWLCFFENVLYRIGKTFHKIKKYK
jgi:hypothetical protein